MSLYRRNRTTELFLLIVVSIFLLYGYYSMQDLRTKLTLKHRETEKTHHYARLLREQLKVLYKHTGKLEQALKTEKTTHKTTKQQLVDKVEEFQLNATKTKHEAVNRFNALDTDYKMLKANYEETYQNYAVLQQQHVRLNEAHKNLLSTSKSECEKVKFDMENETLHLHSRIQALYRENMESHQLSEQYYTYYQESLNQVKSANDLAQKYKDKVKYYVTHMHRMQRQLKACHQIGNETTAMLSTSLMSENAEVLSNEEEILEQYKDITDKDVLQQNKVTQFGYENRTGTKHTILLSDDITGHGANRSLVVHDDDDITDITTTERPLQRNIVPVQGGRPIIQHHGWGPRGGTSKMVTPLSKPTDIGYTLNNNQQPVNMMVHHERYYNQSVDNIAPLSQFDKQGANDIATLSQYDKQSANNIAALSHYDEKNGNNNEAALGQFNKHSANNNIPALSPHDKQSATNNKDASVGVYHKEIVNNIATGGYPQDGAYLATNTDEGSFGGSSKSETDEERSKGMSEERSGANMELTELLDNKPLYISLHQRDTNQQARMKRQQQSPRGDVDNKDIREVNLDDEGEQKMSSNSSPL